MLASVLGKNLNTINRWVKRYLNTLALVNYISTRKLTSQGACGNTKKTKTIKNYLINEKCKRFHIIVGVLDAKTCRAKYELKIETVHRMTVTLA